MPTCSLSHDCVPCLALCALSCLTWSDLTRLGYLYRSIISSDLLSSHLISSISFLFSSCWLEIRFVVVVSNTFYFVNDSKILSIKAVLKLSLPFISQVIMIVHDHLSNTREVSGKTEYRHLCNHSSYISVMISTRLSGTSEWTMERIISISACYWSSLSATFLWY